MRRPVWILALLFALLVAAVFAWLGQWQLENAIRTDAEQVADTEIVRPLADAADPALAVTEGGAGAVVSFEGSLIPGDFVVIEPRVNAGENGAWVVGHVITTGEDAATDASIAVAVGWAPDAAAAQTVIEELETDPGTAAERHFEGRYMPAESAVVPHPDADPFAMTTMVPAHLVNLWADTDGAIYAGYIVMHDTADTTELFAELSAIDSVAPEPAEAVSWLNVFYAIEWIVFAGFAVFFWFRLTRDAWEKDHEMQLLVAAEAAVDTPVETVTGKTPVAAPPAHSSPTAQSAQTAPADPE